jgi:glycine C-acetyltransferase
VNARERIASVVTEIETLGAPHRERVLLSAGGARARFDDTEEDVVVLCVNDYLGFANDPDVVNAAKEGLERYGAGSASARFIAGTTAAHVDLEDALADLVGTQDAITFSSCSTANHAVVATLSDAETLICSDELNHASIIDAIRLARAGDTVVYPHGDVNALRQVLEAHPLRKRALVITDGVFSMEGDVAPLRELVDLCRVHDALLIVDDSHGTGVLGATGRGTAEHFGLIGEIDAVTGTLGKALGGAAGGFVAGSTDLVRILRQRARPYVFSNPVPPSVACGALESIQKLLSDPSRLARLREVTGQFQTALSSLGLNVRHGPGAIIACVIGEESRTRALSAGLLERGVLVTPFAYPVVPRGAARLRIQTSAALAPRDIEQAIEAFRSVTQRT